MNQELILRAARYAGHAHGTQTRKSSDEPYINHPLRVAHEATLVGLPPEAVAAALLHDVVEDTEATFEDIQRLFPPRVAELVQLLTQWWSDYAPAEEKLRERPKYYGAIVLDQDAVNIKLLDRADNLRDMTKMLPRARKWAERYFKKTEIELASVFEVSTNDAAKSIYVEALRGLEAALGSHPRRTKPFVDEPRFDSP